MKFLGWIRRNIQDPDDQSQTSSPPLSSTASCSNSTKNQKAAHRKYRSRLSQSRAEAEHPNRDYSGRSPVIIEAPKRNWAITISNLKTKPGFPHQRTQANKLVCSFHPSGISPSLPVQQQPPLPTEFDQHEYTRSSEHLASSKPLDLSRKVDIELGPPREVGQLTSVQVGRWECKMVAVKVINARRGSRLSKDSEEEIQKQLWVVINAWAPLNHPNILKFHGYQTDYGNFPAIVVEWCQNGSIESSLKKNPSTKRQKRVAWVQNVANGLSFLHSQGIIHGRLNPENVLVDDKGVAKLCDFSLTAVGEATRSYSAEGATSSYGEMERYRAPELFPSRLNPKPQASFASDVYSLSCIVAKIMESQIPYGELDTVYDIPAAARQGKSPFNRPDDLPSDFHRLFWDFLEDCCAGDPKTRLSAGQAVQRIHGIVGVSLTTITPPRQSNRELAPNIKFIGTH